MPRTPIRVVFAHAWGGRALALVPYLAALQPDILCLRDVNKLCTEEDEARFNAHLRNQPPPTKDILEPPGQLNLFSTLTRAFPDHASFFEPETETEWDLGNDMSVQSHRGPAILVNREIPVLHHAVRFVAGSFKHHNAGFAPQVAQTIRVRDERYNCDLLLAQTEGVFPTHTVIDDAVHQTQAERFRQFILGEGAAQRIICTAFAPKLEDSAIAHAFRGLNLLDLAQSQNIGDTRPPEFASDSTPLRDRVFVSRNLAITYGVLDDVVSDRAISVLEIE